MDKLDSFMSNMSGKCPCAIIGTPAQEFRKKYNGPIRNVHSIDEVRDLVSQYVGVPYLEYPLVIDDLYFLNKKAVPMLLKLVEESTFNIILLSSFDCLSPVLLSRIKLVIKKTEPVESQFCSPKSASVQLSELPDDAHATERLKLIIQTAPIIYYLNSRIKSTRNREKILSILE